MANTSCYGYWMVPQKRRNDLQMFPHLTGGKLERGEPPKPPDSARAEYAEWGRDPEKYAASIKGGFKVVATIKKTHLGTKKTH
jgi:hypothetical protein